MSKVYGVKIRIQKQDSIEYKFVENFGVFTSSDAAQDEIDEVIEEKVECACTDDEDEGYEAFVDVNCHDGFKYTDSDGIKVYVSYYIVELEVRS